MQIFKIHKRKTQEFTFEKHMIHNEAHKDVNSGSIYCNCNQIHLLYYFILFT